MHEECAFLSYAKTAEMQSVIQFERANPLQQLVGLSRAMALPHEYAPTRFPSFPALERTAVMGFNTPFGYTVSNTAGQRGFLSRQAAYPLWLENLETQTWSYMIVYDEDMRLTQNGNYQTDQFITRTYVGDVVRTGLNPGISASGRPRCGYPVLGLDSTQCPQTWFYAPAGGWIYVNVVYSSNAPTVDPNITIQLDRWTAPGESFDINFVATNFTAGSPSIYGWKAINTNDSGWYRVSRILGGGVFAGIALSTYSVMVTNANTVTVTPPTATLCPLYTVNATFAPCLMPVAAPPEFTNSILPYSSTRTTAAAVLFTNVTKVLNKEGTILGGRLNPATADVFNFSKTLLAAQHPAEKQLLGLETGFYTFCPPSTDLSNFWDYALPVPYSSPVPLYRLDNDALVNAFVFDDPDGGTNLAVNLDWHLEFRTTSALWQIALSTIPIEVLHQAQLSLVSAGFFFQNETHESVLKRVMPVLKSAAASLMPALANMNPLTKVAYAATKKLISNKPRSGPPPTTLKQSSRADSKKSKPPPKKGKKGKGKK